LKKKEAKVILKNDLYGLILAGGKSSRMQTDKGELQYHESTNQRTYLYKMLNSFCSRTFVSCRNDQLSNLQIGEEYILDENLYHGPLNGILSAHHLFPHKALMVLAVDLPHITDKTIAVLINERDPLKLATVYVSHLSQNPEPLIAIWEAAALEEAEKYIKSGNHCPRKFLTGRDIKTVFPENDRELFNANFYTDYLEAKKRMAES
jgi:molybdopterin-guanine dinucleotide biosynthesis protein A